MAYIGYHAPGSENKISCLSLPVLKNSHFVHLLLLLLLSLLLLPPGVLLLVSSPPLLPPSLLSLFSSFLLLSCVPLGWWAARSERPSLLAVYSTLLLVSILLQLGLAAAAVLYRLETGGQSDGDCKYIAQGWSPRGSSQWCEDPDQGIQEQLYGKPGAKSFTGNG